MFRSKAVPFITAGAFTALAAGPASALDVEVSVTNIAPDGGVVITPLWVGFHDGSFDSYNGGLSSQEGLERIAEDGDTSRISADFLGGYTYIDNSSGTPASAFVLTSQTTGRVDGTIGSLTGPPPIQPGETVVDTFTIDTTGDNRYFSYASMVLPSNDFYIANGNPFAHDLSGLYGAAPGTSVSFFIGQQVNDAGTEENDFAFSAGNGLFPQLGLPSGQAGPNLGTATSDGINIDVLGIPFAGFANSPADLSLNPAAALLDFQDATLYPNGLAQVTIRVVPEPATLSLVGLGGLALLRRRS